MPGRPLWSRRAATGRSASSPASTSSNSSPTGPTLLADRDAVDRPMAVPPIPTERFELVSMSLRFMQLLVARDLEAAEDEIGAIVPVDLPDTLDNFLQFRIADLS